MREIEEFKKYFNWPHPVSRDESRFSSVEKLIGGRAEKCPLCGGILWVPFNPEEPIECKSIEPILMKAVTQNHDLLNEILKAIK